MLIGLQTTRACTIIEVLVLRLLIPQLNVISGVVDPSIHSEIPVREILKIDNVTYNPTLYISRHNLC